MKITQFVLPLVALIVGYSISPSYSQDGIFCDGFECAAGDPELEARIAALEALLANVSRGVDPNTSQDTLTFTNMNVQIVNGYEFTYAPPSGTGNLIIGYNELRPEGNDRSGSHMLVIGSQNNYTANSLGGMVVGELNETSFFYASVSGGTSNIASGVSASVSGGSGNTASGESTSVSGGQNNTASADWASVSGGISNTASGVQSSVSGGDANIASGINASVTGGQEKTAAANNCIVGDNGIDC